MRAAPLFALLGAITCLAPAEAANRCVSDSGKVTYQDTACPASAKTAETLKYATPTVDPDPATLPRIMRRIVPAGEPDEVIRAKCRADWPNDYRMQGFCVGRQVEALRQLDAAIDAPASDAATIRLKCASDWPDDFRMRVFCQQQQVQGLRKVYQASPVNTGGNSAAAEACRKLWPDDFRMRAHCLQRGGEAPAGYKAR